MSTTPVRSADRYEWSVAVFAYNEEDFIIASLESIRRACEGRLAAIHVLANGCTDRTPDIVRRYASDHEHVFPLVLSVGDKCNAWNTYVRECPREADVHFFCDGDVRITPPSFHALADALQQDSAALAASGIPVTGRSQRAWAKRIVDNHGLPGPLYALRGSLVRRMQAEGFALPIGLIIEDGYLNWIIKRDLDPTAVPVRTRVTPCTKAGFENDSMVWWKLRDWKLYYRRLMRTSLGHMQQALLFPALAAGELKSLPPRIEDLYRSDRAAALTPRTRPLMYYFDRLAIRRIRATARETR